MILWAHLGAAASALDAAMQQSREGAWDLHHSTQRLVRTGSVRSVSFPSTRLQHCCPAVRGWTHLPRAALQERTGGTMGRAAPMRNLMMSPCRRQPAMGAQLPMGTTHALLQKPCPRQAGSQACWVCSSHGLLNVGGLLLLKVRLPCSSKFAGSGTPGPLCGRLCCQVCGSAHARGRWHPFRAAHLLAGDSNARTRLLRQLCSQSQERGTHRTCLQVTKVLDWGWLQMHSASLKMSKAYGMPAGHGSTRPGAVQ